MLHFSTKNRLGLLINVMRIKKSMCYTVLHLNPHTTKLKMYRVLLYILVTMITNKINKNVIKNHCKIITLPKVRGF